MASRPSSPGTSAGATLRDVSRETLGAAVTATVQRISRVTEMSSREVTAAGDALELIVREARAHVGEARGALECLTGTKATHGVGPLLAAQAQSTERYLDEVARLVELQRAATSRAMSLTKKIVGLGEQISSVSLDVRLLSLNASIEAARLGDQGDAFRLIASEMKRLRETVDTTNSMVAEVAGAVCKALPEIESGAESLHSCSLAFSNKSRAQLQLVDEENKRMQQQANASLTSGESRLRAILSASADALSHLQFQDPCAQSLQIIEVDLTEAANRVTEAIEGADAGDARVRAGKALMGAFLAATSNRRVSAGEVAALSREVDAPDAGEVVLF